MNGIRCAINLGDERVDDDDSVDSWVTKWGAVYPLFARAIRIFGSHSEAKRELRNYWIESYSCAKVVDETEIDG